MDDAKEQLSTLMRRSQTRGVDVTELDAVQGFLGELSPVGQVEKRPKCRKWLRTTLILGVLCYALNFYHQQLQSQRCLLELPRLLRYAFRPPERCDFCANVRQVPRLSGVSREEFRDRHAYSGVPAVVSDATQNWTALQTFDYWYFRDVYRGAKRRQRILDCQFLPYKTGFRNIYEALDMSPERVAQQPGTQPWYFGWSNCNPETAEIFRRHYGRPYFLPETAENNAVDWFFIGTDGLGAHMHIDNVRLPSWQAQLSGRKRWLLAPPPECYFECSQFDVVVETGDIIVLDTNRWYHQTFVEPGELSLTIGAEYD